MAMLISPESQRLRFLRPLRLPPGGPCPPRRAGPRPRAGQRPGDAAALPAGALPAAAAAAGGAGTRHLAAAEEKNLGNMGQAISKHYIDDHRSMKQMMGFLSWKDICKRLILAEFCVSISIHLRN